jgi:hypothetical protein
LSISSNRDFFFLGFSAFSDFSVFSGLGGSSLGVSVGVGEVGVCGEVQALPKSASRNQIFFLGCLVVSGVKFTKPPLATTVV